jgi:hypothetical protein
MIVSTCSGVTARHVASKSKLLAGSESASTSRTVSTRVPSAAARSSGRNAVCVTATRAPLSTSKCRICSAVDVT